jgi:hypothetical protein
VTEMNSEKLRERIETGFYDDIAKAYKSSHTGPGVRFIANRNARDAFKADLELMHFGGRYSKSDNVQEKFGKKLDRLFELAWEYGHSNGYTEVAGHYDDLVNLVK